LTSEESNINKIFVSEDKNKFINNLYGESKIENNEFIEPDHKLTWKYSKQNSYHFKQDIDRVWLMVKNFDLLSLINNMGHYPCISTKGRDTWKIGNEFKGNLFGLYPFIARVEKVLNLPEIKKIKWLFNLNNKDYVIIKFELFKVTEDNSCVIFSKTKIDNIEINKKAVEKFKENQPNALFKKVEGLLEKEPINLLQFESGIISAKMIDIWNIVTDFNKLTIIAPNNYILPHVNIGEIKQGEMVSASIWGINNEINKIELSLVQKEERPGWNKWLFILLISSGDAKLLPKHTVVFQLTKINNYECQLALMSKFHQSIDTNKFQDISKRKKYLLLSLKNYFDNFYSPSINN
jgi:hypothetical protein